MICKLYFNKEKTYAPDKKGSLHPPCQPIKKWNMLRIISERTLKGQRLAEIFPKNPQPIEKADESFRPSLFKLI